MGRTTTSGRRWLTTASRTSAPMVNAVLDCTECPWVVQGNGPSAVSDWRKHMIEEHQQDPLPDVNPLMKETDLWK